MLIKKRLHEIHYCLLLLIKWLSDLKINKNVNKLELSEQETNENFCFNFQSEIGLKLQILSKECFFLRNE